MESMSVEHVNGGVEGKYEESKIVVMRVDDAILRLLSFSATLVATLIMATAKQTETVYVQVVSTLPPLPITVTAKAKYSSAFVYFIVANSVALAYSALSLGVAFVAKNTKSSKMVKSVLPALAIMDLIMVSLLFSGIGAAAAIGMVAEHGNSHVGWKKVCDVFGSFCSHGKIAIANSSIASLAYITLVIISVIRLQRKQSNS